MTRFLIWFPLAEIADWSSLRILPALASSGQDVIVLATIIGLQWATTIRSPQGRVWRSVNGLFGITYFVLILIFTLNLLSIMVNRTALDFNWLRYVNARDADTTTAMMRSALTPSKIILVVMCLFVIPIAAIQLAPRYVVNSLWKLPVALFGFAALVIVGDLLFPTPDPLKDSYKRQMPLLVIVQQSIFPSQTDRFLNGQTGIDPIAEASVAASDWRAQTGTLPPTCCFGMNILHVTIDSVPRNRMSREFFLRNAATFPNLARLYQSGTDFSAIYSNRPSSDAALSTMATSTYASNNPRAGVFSQFEGNEVANLPTLLSEHGYDTALFMSGQVEFGGAAPLLKTWGMGTVHGSRSIRCKPDEAALIKLFSHAGDVCTATAAADWLAMERNNPFYLWVWFTNPHTPYFNEDDPYIKAERTTSERHLRALHDTDAALGQLLSSLNRQGLTKNTIIILSSDHGEAFGEHGLIYHATAIYDEQVSIGLVINVPGHSLPPNSGVAGSLIDLAPTIAGLVGLPAPTQWQGTSLFANKRPERVYFNSLEGNRMAGFREGNMKFTIASGDDRPFAFDLGVDPREKNTMRMSTPEAARVGAKISAFIRQRDQQTWPRQTKSISQTENWKAK